MTTKHTLSISEALGVCPLCGEKYEPSFTGGPHKDCQERIKRAAPDLLAALEQLRDLFTEYTDQVGDFDIDFVDAAIAKAKGE